MDPRRKNQQIIFKFRYPPSIDFHMPLFKVIGSNDHPDRVGQGFLRKRWLFKPSQQTPPNGPDIMAVE
ncbi:MAG TPA: hypothetical protein DDZ76_08380 [Xanthomonadales bacterium]|nr:hypothetical protein [Xanthomonadales bacterium]